MTILEMRPGFQQRLVNGHFEDPSLYVRIPWQKRAILFDAGDLRRLTPTEIYKISDLFITHTHIDHFIGFDTVLRVVLRRQTALNVYGPPPISSRLEGKLKGYSWNLIKDYPTVINVFSYNGRTVTHSVFSAQNGFRRKTLSCTKSDGTLLQDSFLRVRAARVDHDIPCLAYGLDEAMHININKDRLKKMGIPVGPWLSDFKEKIRSGPVGTETFNIEKKSYRLSELAGIADIKEGQKICYATDIGITTVNLKRLVRLAQRADIFYCEAFFLEEDRELAVQRHHLTAKVSGSIAGMASVRKLVPIHFSPRYMQCPERVIKEAHEEFLKYSATKTEIQKTGI